MFPSHSTSKIEDKNWMSNIPDERFLNEITIPGTHDSCTKNLVSNVIEAFGTTQCLYIPDQLKAGVRFFDLRIAYCEDVKGKLTISHAVFFARDKDENYLSYTDGILVDIENFLQENPSETVLIAPGYEDGDKNVYSEHMLNWWNTVKDKKTPDGSKNLYYYEERIPKLGEVRGRIVMVRRKCFGYGKDEWKNLTKDIGINFKIDSMEIIKDDLRLENHYEFLAQPKIECISKYLKECQNENYEFSSGDKSSNKLKVIFTSSNCPPKVGPTGIAEEVNKYIKYQNLEKGKVYGWVLMDFACSCLEDMSFSQIPPYYYYLTNVFKDEEPKTYISDLWIACVGRSCGGFSDRENAMSLILKNRMYIDGTDIQAGRSRKFMLMGHLMSGFKNEAITGIGAFNSSEEPTLNNWKWYPVKGNDDNQPQNLNAGVRTDTKIYLFYTKDPAAGSPISQIKMVTSFGERSYESFQNLGWDSACWNYSDPEPADLKKNTGYDYVYCVFKRIDGSFRNAKAENLVSPESVAAPSEAKIYPKVKEGESTPLTQETIEYEEVEEKRSNCCCCARCNCCCCRCCICRKKLICKCCY